MTDEPLGAEDDEPDADEGDSTPAPEPGNAVAGPKARRRRETQAKVEQRQAAEFWAVVFASDVGRREMWRILESSHAFEERFACGPNGFPQSEATWFNAGEQSFGLRLYQKWLALDPVAVMLMHTEHDHRFQSNAKARR